MGDKADRLTASAAFAKRVARTPEIVADGATVVVCLETDTIREVLNRVMSSQARPPVALAIYWPDSGHLAGMSLAPGAAPDAESVGSVDPGSTVGMLYDLLRQRADHRFTITTAAASTALSLPVELISA